MTDYTQCRNCPARSKCGVWGKPDEKKQRKELQDNYAAQMDMLGYKPDGNPKEGKHDTR